MQTIRVAAVQAAPMLFNRPESEARFAAWISQACARGADIAVFPEAFLGGYPKGIDFGARVGSRSAEGREQFRRYFEASYARDGPEFEAIRTHVANANIHVVVGIIERLGTTLFCASVTIGRGGEILAWHRKLMPTAMERLIWGLGDGATMNVAQTEIGIVGTAICWENYMPLYRTHLYSQHTQIYCAPTVDDREVWVPTMRMIAVEGRCFVVSTCQYMTRADVDGDYDALQGNSPDTVLIGGGSVIVSPMGDVLAGPLCGEAGVLVADIDLGDIARAKFDLDVTGHYARPDIFSLAVNTGKRL